MSTQQYKTYGIQVPIIHTCEGNPIHLWGDGSFGKSIFANSANNSNQISGVRSGILARIPRMLYKFQPYDDLHIKALANQEIWLANPLTLNDPFDPLPYFDKKKIEEFSNELSKKGFWKKILEILPAIFGCKKSEPINEDITGFVLAVLARYTRIFSMASRWDVPLLWGHYADGHRGFALGYSGKKIKDMVLTTKKMLKSGMLYEVVPIVYDRLELKKGFFDATRSLSKIHEKTVRFHKGNKNGHPIMNYEDFLSLLQCYVYKSLDWHYEREWRLIRFCPEPSECEDNKKNGTLIQLQPDSIYLGVRMDKNRRETICNIVCNINRQRPSDQQMKIYRVKGLLYAKGRFARLQKVGEE